MLARPKWAKQGRKAAKRSSTRWSARSSLTLATMGENVVRNSGRDISR
ncbi:unnamed protein product [Laminaria digitata]